MQTANSLVTTVKSKTQQQPHQLQTTQIQQQETLTKQPQQTLLDAQCQASKVTDIVMMEITPRPAITMVATVVAVPGQSTARNATALIPIILMSAKIAQVKVSVKN